MDESLAKELREGRGLALTFYLDAFTDDREVDRLIDAWNDRGGFVSALDRQASISLLRWLLALPTERMAGFHDEASRAVDLFAVLGPDRQAMMVNVIEGLHCSKDRAGRDERDPLAGYLEEVEQQRRDEAELRHIAMTGMYRQGWKDAGGSEDEDEEEAAPEPSTALLEALCVVESMEADGAA